MSLIRNCYIVFVYVFLLIINVSNCFSKNEKHQKFDLIDLKNEHQRLKTALLEKHRNAHRIGRFGDYNYNGEVTDAMDVNNEVDASLLARKVWSRWSKWGQCSATCGGGAKTRRRLCLAGRCAPGEREEQRRPCCCQPCELL